MYSLLGVESEDLVSEVLFSWGIEIGLDLTGKLKLSPGLSVDIFDSYDTSKKNTKLLQWLRP